MRVIHQIINYLKERGILSESQIDYLRNEGFVDKWYGVEGCEDFDVVEEIEEEVVQNADRIERLWEREIERRQRRNIKAKRGFRPKGKILTKADLNHRLRHKREQSRQELEGMLQIAAALVESANSSQAPLIVSQMEVGVLGEILSVKLASQKLSLKELWDALGFDGYRAVISKEEKLQGATVNAYRAILSGTSRASLNRYAWILKMPEVGYTYHLIQAQRKSFIAFGSVCDRYPRLMSRLLQQQYHAEAYLAFTLVYNSRYLGRRSKKRDYNPYRQMLKSCQIDWHKAWSQALLMNPKQVTPFLARHFTNPSELYYPKPGEF